jgi:hypothetical protein
VPPRGSQRPFTSDQVVKESYGRAALEARISGMWF